MPPVEPLLPCPFCQGKGHMPRTEIFSRLEDPDLPEKIVAELNHSSETGQEVAAGSGEKPGQPGDFASKVHGWNRHMLWRRSSKE